MTTAAVRRVTDELRRMIVSGELLPGQPVRQEHMAEQLGVSRVPVREALRLLSADGLVSHVHNVEYAVTRLGQKEFGQIASVTGRPACVPASRGCGIWSGGYRR